MRPRPLNFAFAVLLSWGVLSGAGTPATAARPSNGTGPAPASATVDPKALPPGWRTSTDEALLLTGDEDGFHVMVAEQRTGYRWRTVATLREPIPVNDSWIGNGCLTGSGRRAVVVYAPRTFTNRPELSARGAFAAVVDIVSGSVTKLPVTTSLAYFNPGCGAGETAVLTQEGGETLSGTRLVRLDASTGRTYAPILTAGQVTSAVPLGSAIAGARGGAVFRIDAHGRQLAIANTDGVAFQLRADSAGGLVYLDHKGAEVRVRRTANAATTTLATGSLGRIGLAQGSAGTVYVTGAGTHITARLPKPVHAVDAPSDAILSTTGALSVSLTTAGSSLQLTGSVLASRTPVRFDVRPDKAAPLGDIASPALKTVAPAGTGPGARTSLNLGSPTDPTDADRSCAVPRNDPLTQVYQPTARQVEWAVDEAVQNALTLTRPAGWKHDALPAYSPQAMFPPLTLAGGNNDTPPQIMLGILAQESNLWQASGHALSGEYGNPLIGNYYGLQLYDSDPNNDWDIDFSNADCGYGVAQITDGMRLAGHERPGEVALPPTQQRAIALDYTVNIAAGLRLLQSKWNEVYNAGLQINDGSPSSIENWFYAVWAYNSGFHPNAGGGTPWGLGWSNNPVNPRYPVDRPPFLENGYTDAKIPQYWPYQEKVLGWAGHPIVTPDGEGFRQAWWVTDLLRQTVKPPVDLFCDASNECYPGQTFPNQFPSEPPGPCARMDLTCWYHQSASWKDCRLPLCGTGLIRFDTTYPEQPDGDHYPPNCALAGLPAGSLIIDDVSDAVPPVRPGCDHPYANSGTFGLTFASDSSGRYPSKVDFHQLGGGFGGHFWFTHSWSDSGTKLKVTGAWTLNQRLTGWARVLVHLPDHGAVTRQAAYTIDLGNDSKTRVIPQRVMANEWVPLGVFLFAGTPSVTLSNVTGNGDGSEDVAWDAVAFQPLPAKPRDFVVAMGDSYSSGENASGDGGVDYYPETDVDGGHGLHTEDLCHRSRLAWSRKASLPDSPATLGTRADTLASDTDFHFIACSGAPTSAVTSSWWYGEAAQLDTGFLDENTTLVTLSIGGNDARFYDILVACNNAVQIPHDCMDDTLPNDSQPMSQTEPTLIAGQVRASILYTLKEIHKKARHARIVLMGYPVIFNPAVGCSSTTLLSSPEQAWLNDMTNLLASTEQSLASDAAADPQDPVPVTYADARPAFAGKGVCGNPEDVSGPVLLLTPGEGGGVGQSDQSFHPNPGGTDVYASILTSTLLSLGNSPADSYGGTTTGTVNVRSGPSTNAAIVGSLAINTPVHVFCAAQGTMVNGTKTWDQIGTGQYVSDAYVNTGTSLPIAQPCGAPAAGSLDISVVSGCSSAGPNTNSNYGATYSVTADWFAENNSGGCSNATGRYLYTWGNGPQPSSDYARWGYYPGAYATCTLSVAVPPSNGRVFDSKAHYQVITGADHATVIADLTVDQIASAGNASVPLSTPSNLYATYTADGSGYLAVRLDDTSQTGSSVRAVASTAHFTNCRAVG
jgi:uncharacterized protein YraI